MLTISGKNLAALNLSSVCTSCFKVKIKLESQIPVEKKKIPFQIPFPGVFTSLDSHVKSVVKKYFDSKGTVPKWFPNLGKKIVAIEKPPSWQNFNHYFNEYDIKLTGSIDTILRFEDNSFAFGDFKTATITNTQDMLEPLYKAQLHAYREIARANKTFQPVNKLVLIYTEPISYNYLGDHHYSLDSFDNNFHLHFNVQKKELDIEEDLVFNLIKKFIEIMKNPMPPKLDSCPNCVLRERLILEEKNLILNNEKN